MSKADEIKIENKRDKDLYMQGYEQALKDINVDVFFRKGYMHGIEVENQNFIRNLEEYLYDLEEKRKSGNPTIGYWQVRGCIKEVIEQCRIN